jgi:alpha-galactosidase
MGWNSWNSLGTGVTEQQVVQTIDFMAANGLAAAGYDTVTIDDGWSLGHRSDQSTDLVKNAYGAMQLYDAAGNPVAGTDGTGIDPTSGHLVPNQNFPSRTVNGQSLNGIAYLAWYAHTKGMKFGLYATDTYTTCQGHPGSLGHESTDAADFISWGVDFVKYDDCPYGPQIVGPDGHDYYTQGEGRELTQSMYSRVQTFQRALDAASAAQNRPKAVMSVSAQPVHTGVPYLLSPNDPARTDSVIAAAGTPAYQAPGYSPTGIWCGQVANLCRIGGDRDSELDGVLYQGQLSTALQYRAGVRPGAWNDMDMMFTGWNDVYGVYGVTDTCPCHKPFTDTESQTEMSVLSMMAAPLISGADLRDAADSVHTWNGATWSTGISPASLGILKNADVVAVDQDSLGVPATLVGNPPASGTSPVVLERRLANGDTAVALVNQDPTATQTVSVSASALNLTANAYQYKELWTSATGTLTSSGTLTAAVAPHGVAMYRITAPPSTTPATVIGDGWYHTLSDGGTGQNVLEVAGMCSAPAGGDADINVWDPTHTSEKWEFVAEPDGSTRIYDHCDTSTQLHGSLTAPAAGSAPGTAASVQNTFDPNDPRQKWLVTQNSAGVLTITNPATGYVLGAAGTASRSLTALNPASPSDATQGWTVIADFS